MLINKIVRQAASVIAFCILGSISLFASDQGEIHRGYYRYPAIHGETIIFTSEGDLWSVSAQGGFARRITSNAGSEAMAVISPDGETVAFRAEYGDRPRSIRCRSMEDCRSAGPGMATRFRKDGRPMAA